jgi:uncharacterized protein
MRTGAAIVTRASCVSLALAAGMARAAAPVPPLAGPVVDTAGLLDPGAARRLESLARAARAGEGGHGVQLQYLLVRSLEGEPIEDYSIRVAEAWKIGSKGRDNGVLVTVAVEDRSVRIEVGGGLEGGLTDVQASRIIRATIVPAFREGRFGEGLYDAGVQILSALGALPRDVTARGRARGVTGLPTGAGALLALFVVLWIVGSVFRGFGPRRRRHLWWGGGPWIGGGGWGGGGGFGGGGGGWSGGGGGFSGGGASGKW